MSASGPHDVPIDASDSSVTPFLGGLCPSAPSPTSAARTHRGDENVDVWWGSYSSLTLLPSWIGCALVAVLIAWGCWYLQIRGVLRLCFLGIACLVCLYQFVRWANRVFGCNYRLTTRELFCECRFMARSILRINLQHVARVETHRTGMEQLLGIGRVVLFLVDAKQPVVLEGVRHPQRVAEIVRGEVNKSRRV